MIELLVLVERAVRPVRATPAWKLRMRDELLTHLTAVYEDERARLGDDRAALAGAARRFGDPASLARELEESLSPRDRLAGRLDRWFGWRPPESAARYMLRPAGLAFLALLPAGLGPAALGPWSLDGAVLLRIWAALLVIGPADVFLLGWLYFRARDAWHGPPWAARSRGRAAGYTALYAPACFASALGLHLAGTLDAGVTLDAMLGWDAIAACGALGAWLGGSAAVSVLSQGPDEIRHTLWSGLDLGNPAAG